MPVQVLSIAAGAALEACRAVDADGNYSTAGAPLFGLTIEGSDASGETIAVLTDGAHSAEAGGSFAQGAELAVGTTGKLVAAASADSIVGVAMEASTGDGDVVLVKIKFMGVKA